MGTFKCELKDGCICFLTGVEEVEFCDGLLIVVTNSISHYALIKNIEKYTISF